MELTWDPDLIQAEVTWRGRLVALLFVPKFTDVPNMTRPAYLFNRSGNFLRFPDEESACAYLENAIDVAEAKLAKRAAA